jgi:hypothetical protein
MEPIALRAHYAPYDFRETIMILFAEDWSRYPTAIVDTKTKNISFIRLAALYRSMGIRNHAFVLALLNPQLQGVDPYSPSLTIEQKAMIAMECKLNPWYFFREVARAPAIGGTEATQFEANRAVIAAYWLFFNHIMFLWIQIRQTGKSFGIDMLMNLLLHIVCNHTKINLLTKDDNLRRANILRLKEQADEFPDYLNQRGPTDASNTEEITVNALDNRYSTHVPQASEKNAIKVGRGLTTAIFHVDEPPFQAHIQVALESAFGAMGAAIEKSKRENAPWGVILTTTAAKKDTPSGRFVFKMTQDSAAWSELFLDCANIDMLEEMVRRNSRGGVYRVALIMNHRQVGKSDKWLLDRLEGALQSPESANRDFFNMWTSGTETSPIPGPLLERIVGSHMDVQYAEVASIGAYITRWYIPESEVQYRMNNSKFILGMDTSEASGNDDISLVLLDAYTMEVVAAGTYNDTNLIKFSAWVAAVLCRFVNVTAIIERRSTGVALLDYLLFHLPEMGVDPFRRLYNTAVQHHMEDPDRYAEIKVPMNRRDPEVYTKYKKCFGFVTSGSGENARSALYSTALNTAVVRGPDKVHDKTLIDQIAGLITKNGRIDHGDGEHDDMVIGWLLCFWLIVKGVNLIFYGIDSRMVTAGANRQSLDPRELAAMDEQRQLRVDIEALADALGREKDEYMSLRIEQAMRSLMLRVIQEENNTFTVDELIRSAKERRRNRKQLGLSPSAPAWQTNAPLQSGYSRDTPPGAWRFGM